MPRTTAKAPATPGAAPATPRSRACLDLANVRWVDQDYLVLGRSEYLDRVSVPLYAHAACVTLQPEGPQLDRSIGPLVELCPLVVAKSNTAIGPLVELCPLVLAKASNAIGFLVEVSLLVLAVHS